MAATGVRTQIGYGVSFALASLSCTIAPFLAVVVGSVSVGGPSAVAASLLTYAGGMGIVVFTLALAVAAARTSVVHAMRRAGAWIGRGSGALLVVAGSYVAWYGWFEIRVQAGGTGSDPVVSAAARVQAAITAWVSGLGVTGLLVIAAAATLAVVGLRIRRRAARSPGR